LPTWRAWYEDGAVYNSVEMAWQALPAEGLVGVVVYLDPAVTPFRAVVIGGDWYWLEHGEVHASGTMWNGYVKPPDVEPSLLKRSGVLSDEAWTEVQREITAAREAPVV
jgi:hypothetical protein